MGRESKFELLRIVMTFMVITLHYLNPEMGGALEYTRGNEINHILALLLESVCIIAVNIFLIITGYFGYKRMEISLRKPIGLIALLVSYNLLFRLIDLGFGEKVLSFSSILGIFIPANWYIVLYIALIIIAPYLNYLINNLTKMQFRNLIVVMFIIFSLWNTVFDLGFSLLDIKMIGVSTITSNGSQGGYNIVNFVFLYFIGGYISKYSVVMKRSFLVIIYVCTLILTILLGNFTYSCWNYDNVLVIIMSISFFLIWNQSIELGNKKVINIIAKGTIGVYILHTK